MEIDDKFQTFLDKVIERPLPTNPLSRVRILAKELAEGATLELWPAYIRSMRYEISDAKGENNYKLDANLWFQNVDFQRKAPNLAKLLLSDLWLPIGELTNLLWYIIRRWDTTCPDFRLLEIHGYLKFKDSHSGLTITRAAFDLLNETEPSSIFISYRRNESSAFALLVLARLKVAGLDAHLDMAIQPGDNWHAHLKEEIQKRDYFILLLGNETLTSEVVCKEILWALEAKATILPIWHNGFQYTGQYDLDPKIDDVLRNTHTIRVTDESALGYETALIELLNFFGVTP